MWSERTEHRVERFLQLYDPVAMARLIADLASTGSACRFSRSDSLSRIVIDSLQHQDLSANWLLDTPRGCARPVVTQYLVFEYGRWETKSRKIAKKHAKEAAWEEDCEEEADAEGNCDEDGQEDNEEDEDEELASTILSDLSNKQLDVLTVFLKHYWSEVSQRSAAAFIH